MEAISKEACRVLKLFGKTVSRVCDDRRPGAGIFPDR